MRIRFGAPHLAILAAAALAVPGPAAPAQPAQGAWPGTSIDPSGWTSIGSNDEVWAFYRPPVLKAKKGLPRLWVRYEFRAPQSPADLGNPSYRAYRSSVSLREIDCVRERTRDLQLMTYPDNDLKGSGGWVSSRPAPWTVSAPGTVGDAIQTVACAAH